MNVQLNVTFKDLVRDHILERQLFKPSTNTKYSLDQILDVIEYILITGSSWRSLNLPVFKNTDIKWQSIYFHFQKFAKANVFKKVYLKLLDRYFTKNKSGKLKYLSIDTSFVKNYCASNVAFNGYCKKKRLSKLSLIVDANGVPISALLARGNNSDQKLFYSNIDDPLVRINSQNNNNKHKRYLLADAIYDTNQIRSKIKHMNITPIIAFNKRNSIKDTRIMTDKHKQIFRKRMIVENTFSWIYQNHRTNGRYDKLTRTYYSFLFMAFIKILLKRL
jgi:transposase